MDMTKNIVTTVWEEKMRFETDNPSGHKLLIDAGEENGGESKGHRPKALMLSSLAGCSGLNLSVEKYCGVMEMFRQFADVSIATFYHEA